MKKTRAAVFTAMILILSLMLLDTTPLWAGKADDTLNVAYWRSVTTLDGNYSTRRENDILGLCVDESLFYVDPETLKPVPLLAKTYSWVDDLTLDIEMRSDVKFHDGSLVTPQDMAYTLNTIVDKKSQNSFSLKVGMWLEKTSVTGPNSIRLHLKRPYANVLWDLCYYVKVRKNKIYDNPEKKGEYNSIAQQNTLIGAGPYRVVKFDPGERIVLERFADYRKDSPKGVPAIKRIVIRTIPDFSTQAAEVMSGGIDWSYQVPYEVAESVAESGRGKLVSGFSMRIGYIVLDARGRTGKDNPLTKLKVRQALNHAVDMNSITKNIVKGKSRNICAPCNPIQFGCVQKAAKCYEFNPQKAKALLTEAGYPDGFVLEFWSGKDKPVMEAIVGMWNAVGVKTTLRYTKGSTVTKAYREGKAAAFYGSKGSYSIPDATGTLAQMFAEESSQNFCGDPIVEKAVVATYSQRDPELRLKAFRQLIKQVTEQAYWVPTHQYSEEYMCSNDVVFKPWDDGMQRLFTISWKK